MIVYSDPGELVLEDSAEGDPEGGSIVIADIETGRDFYVPSYYVHSCTKCRTTTCRVSA